MMDFIQNPDIKLNNVIGLDATKTVLLDALKFHIDADNAADGETSKEILLYGAAGTGKTYLVKAVATEPGNCTLLMVSVYDFLSKHLSAEDRSVQKLFSIAREKRPSIILIDDVDALGNCESDDGGAASRVKAEFLQQMKGLRTETNGVLVIGTTNKPWKLDPDVRKIFEKRIYIPLPEASARSVMFKLHLGSTPNSLSEEDFKELGQRSEGYSGADVSIVLRDALMQPVRRIQKATHYKKVQGPSPDDPSAMMDDLLTPCSPTDPEGIEMNWSDIPVNKLLTPMITMNELLESLSAQQPSVGEDVIAMFCDFTTKFGQEGYSQ